MGLEQYLQVIKGLEGPPSPLGNLKLLPLTIRSGLNQSPPLKVREVLVHGTYSHIKADALPDGIPVGGLLLDDPQDLLLR